MHKKYRILGVFLTLALAMLIPLAIPESAFATTTLAPGSLDTTFNSNIGSGLSGPFSINMDNNKIYIGGNDTAFNGTSSRYIVRLNLNGTYDSTFSIGTGFNNAVRQVLVFPDHTLMTAGNFTSYNGTSSSRTIRLNPDGSVNTAYNYGAGFNATTYDADQYSSSQAIYGGNFGSYNGTSTAARIARVNIADGSLDQTFNTNEGSGFNSYVFAMAHDSLGREIVGGCFGTANGSSSPELARINADGTIDRSFSAALGTGFNQCVLDVAVQPDNKILVGGDFTTFNGSSTPYLVRLNADGSYDTSFNIGTGLNNEIAFANDLLVLPSGKILVGGTFTSYNGISVGGIARLNSDGSLDTSFNSGSGFNSGSTVLALYMEPDGSVLVAGGFTSYNGTTANGLVHIGSEDYLPPGISSISTSAGYATATISWTTDKNASSTVYYGPSAGYGSASSSSSMTTSHSITLIGLIPNTTYHYQIENGSSYGVVGTSSDQTFITGAAPENTAGGAGILYNNGVTPGGPVVIYVNGIPTIPGITTSGFTTTVGPIYALTATTNATSTSNASSTGQLAEFSATTTPSVPNNATTTAGIANVTNVTGGNSSASQGATQTAGTYHFSVNIGFGSKTPLTDSIKELQMFLNDQGYTVSMSGPGSPGKETNVFGYATKAALKKFQKDHGISPTGFLGPITRGVINKTR